MASSATKIQALWRGYRSRKGDVLPCGWCGYDMTLLHFAAAEDGQGGLSSQVPCAWCQERLKNEEPCDCLECEAERRKMEGCDCRECQMGKVMFCPSCGQDECDGLCAAEKAPYSGEEPEKEEVCRECGRGPAECDGYCERYIPCCICGGNCADGDYESWRFCTRRCMVEAGRD
jgi:hypothetical protein